jgi:hypothetical protein
MVVTTLESKFRVYDLRTQHPEEGCVLIILEFEMVYTRLVKGIIHNP